MVISPCKTELQLQCLYWFLGLIAGVYLGWVLAWNPFAASGCIVIVFLTLCDVVHEVIYFGRTFTLDQNGYTISILGYRKFFSWNSVNCLYCDNQNWLLGDSERCNPGVIISIKPIHKPRYLGAMTYCRCYHPFSSVFLAFRTEKIDHPMRTGKQMFTGYIIDRDSIVNVLSNAGIQIT